MCVSARLDHWKSRLGRLLARTEGVHSAAAATVGAGTRCLSAAPTVAAAAQEQRPRGRMDQKPLTLAERQSIAVSTQTGFPDDQPTTNSGNVRAISGRKFVSL